MDLEQFETDLDLEETGAQMPLGDSVMLIRSRSSKRYKEVFREITKGYRHQIQYGSLDERVGEELMGRATALGLIAGWSDNMTLRGKAFPYHKENALKLCLDQKLKHVRQMIEEFAGKPENFGKSAFVDEDGEKNSETLSSGDSSGAKGKKLSA